jgi:hypothetical protein
MKVIRLACTLLMTAWVSSANASLIFDFSFTDILRNNAKVTGEILGLSDNKLGAASSVRVFSNTEGYGVGEYVGLPDDNIFIVSNGVIVSANFLSFGEKNSSPDVTGSSLNMFKLNGGDDFSFAGLINNGIAFNGVSINTSQLVFVKRNVPVPAPSSLILLSLGLAGLSFARYRKQS